MPPEKQRRAVERRRELIRLAEEALRTAFRTADGPQIRASQLRIKEIVAREALRRTK